ncbi:MAG: ribonuclease P protein component [Pseudomonadota bacterium]
MSSAQNAMPIAVTADPYSVPKKFTRQHRLLSAGEFRNVFSSPEFRSGNRIALCLARCRTTNSTSRCHSEPTVIESRLGLAIAKKHLRKAVERNRMKRIARECFREQRHLMAGAQITADVVILSRPNARHANRQQIRSAINQLLAELLTQLAKQR